MTSSVAHRGMGLATCGTRGLAESVWDGAAEGLWHADPAPPSLVASGSCRGSMRVCFAYTAALTAHGLPRIAGRTNSAFLGGDKWPFEGGGAADCCPGHGRCRRQGRAPHPPHGFVPDVRLATSIQAPGCSARFRRVALAAPARPLRQCRLPVRQCSMAVAGVPAPLESADALPTPS